MLKEQSLIILNQQLVLKKEGLEDLVYEKGTLLKVKMVFNDRIVVRDDHFRTFILNQADKDSVWSFL